MGAGCRDDMSAGLLFEQAHEMVVMLLVLPVALSFEQSPTGMSSLRESRESRPP
jgi:hypothetical protein